MRADLVTIRPLVLADAAAVAALADRVYPGSYHLSAEDVRDSLSGPHLCFGAFAEGALRAYLMCWVDTTQVEELGDESVLLLDDIVVEDGRHLILLLRALRRAIVAAGLTGLAMEGTHRTRAEALFDKHSRVVAALGYRRAACHHYFGEREQENLCWARYEPMVSETISGVRH
ncbi:MAG: hypothetical protein KF760_21280 [Candidatus Eremiobacteraeota bacterium]|nr:hypothetical protein [Candidatus Eremiobacteraeota bacterium]MCW5867270.1 hypothetical protein [Candidatus Eremiobacteraeota bacterium]